MRSSCRRRALLANCFCSVIAALRACGTAVTSGLRRERRHQRTGRRCPGSDGPSGPPCDADRPPSANSTRACRMKSPVILFQTNWNSSRCAHMFTPPADSAVLLRHRVVDRRSGNLGPADVPMAVEVTQRSRRARRGGQPADGRHRHHRADNRAPAALPVHTLRSIRSSCWPVLYKEENR